MADDYGVPAPIFEGSEKRLEIHFTHCDPVSHSSHMLASSSGLRGLTRETLDHLMTLAACEILSSTSNSTLDAYVLSESSLFVYPTTWILKTCGNTRPLACLEELLSIAFKHGLKAAFVKYSHASYLHPQLQPEEYQAFPNEVEMLRKHIGYLGNGGSAYQLGDSLYGLQWHVFVAAQPGFVPETMHPASSTGTFSDSDTQPPSERSPPDTPTGTDGSMEKVTGVPLKTLEVCMTELDPEASQQFVRTPSFVSSKHTTQETGINMLLPGAQLDDHMFEPCGYSMNGIKGNQLMTIHVTPEEGFSYASCEVHSFTEASVDTSSTVAALTSIFLPGRFVVSYATGPSSQALTATTFAERPPPIDAPGYSCVGASCQYPPSGGAVFFLSFVRDAFRAVQGASSCPQALQSFPSFYTLARAAAVTGAGSVLGTGAHRKAIADKLASFRTGSSVSEMDCCDTGVATGFQSP